MLIPAFPAAPPLDEIARKYIKSKQDRINSIDAITYNDDQLCMLAAKKTMFVERFYTMRKNFRTGEEHEESFLGTTSLVEAINAAATLGMSAVMPGFKKREQLEETYVQTIEEYKSRNLMDYYVSLYVDDKKNDR